ncbi:hypothetical protein C8R43DRAFT_1138112 [Mycena crocata]|nr:hypothetical protein C8R43DRAFT_1138112 [Mycena crocata]
MTTFSPVAPGTESVPAASSVQSSDAHTIAALQQLTAAVANLSQVQASQAAAASGAALDSLPAAASDATTDAAPAPAAPPGILAPAAFLTHGPWLVGGLYIVVPTAPLMAIVEADAEDKLWYCISQGKFVGITTSNALALRATVRVSGSSMRSFKTQSQAVLEFNDLLRYQMVAVLA